MIYFQQMPETSIVDLGMWNWTVSADQLTVSWTLTTRPPVQLALWTFTSLDDTMLFLLHVAMSISKCAVWGVKWIIVVIIIAEASPRPALWMLIYLDKTALQEKPAMSVSKCAVLGLKTSLSQKVSMQHVIKLESWQPVQCNWCLTWLKMWTHHYCNVIIIFVQRS